MCGCQPVHQGSYRLAGRAGRICVVFCRGRRLCCHYGDHILDGEISLNCLSRGQPVIYSLFATCPPSIFPHQPSPIRSNSDRKIFLRIGPPARNLFGPPRHKCFPHNGKHFREFSTQWKKCFHSMENSVSGLFLVVCRCGRWHSLARRVGPRRYRPRVRPAPCGLDSALGYLGLFSGAVERSTRRPLSTVERDRPRGREKRRPPQAVSALRRKGSAACAARIYSGGC